MLRRVLLLTAVTVVLLLLETSVLGRLRLAGVRPDLLVLAVVAVAMSWGSASGALFGFWAGLVADLLLNTPAGVSAFVYTTIGFSVGVVRTWVVSPRPWVHLTLVAAASLVSVWLAGVALRVLDLSSWSYVARAGVLVAGYNLLLAPFVYPVVRSLAARVRPEQLDG